MTTICGNCKFYSRGNAWSGRCVVHAMGVDTAGAPAGYATSPGRSCQHEPSEFMPRGKADDWLGPPAAVDSEIVSIDISTDPPTWVHR